MAGKKETNRQKMIGMMYIVLTAMLALQVTNTVLDKFVLIDEGLQKTATSTRNDNLRTVRQIRLSVEERGNRDSDLLHYKKSQEVIEKGNDVLDVLASTREKIIELSGGIDKDQQYANIEEENEVMAFMLGSESKQDGAAYQLEKILKDYVAYINKVDTAVKIPPIALNAWEIAQFQKNEDQNKKDFAHINFEETPMIAALAVLSQFQNDMLRAEAKVLEKLAQKVGAEDIPFDQVEAFVSPESRIIPAGTPYKAKVMLVASSSAAKPEMQANVGEIKVGEDGKGLLEFTASANNFDSEGKATRQWNGQISIQTPQGIQTFDISEEYIVQKPTLQFISAAIQTLYFDAGNTLQVAAPELGVHFAPDFTITGGTLKKENNKGKITIVPKAGKVSLTVKNKGTTIGQQDFRVKRIPKPEIKIFNKNKEIDQINGGRVPSRLKAMAIPDQDFKETNPRDARYRVTAWEVMLVRGNTAILTLREDGETINLNEIREKARKGDRLMIQVNEVKRKNYLDDIVDVKVGLQIFQYPVKQ